MGRKIKRVSDVNAMGVPAALPVSQPYNPYSSPYPNTGEFQPQQPNYEFQSTPYVPPTDPAFQNPSTSFLQQQQPTQSSVFAPPVVQDMALQYGQQVYVNIFVY